MLTSDMPRSLAQLLAASVRSTDPGELAQLAAHSDWRVRATIAANESTDLDTLATFETDSDARVRQALQRNAVLERLLVDAHGTHSAPKRLRQLADSPLGMIRGAAEQSLRQADATRAAGAAAAPTTPPFTDPHPLTADQGVAPEAPAGLVLDPGGKLAKLVQRKRLDNPEVVREVVKRTVRRLPPADRGVSNEMLTAQYGRHKERVACQICREPSAFRRNDGKWYFEVVQLMKLTHEDVDNRIALCPTCSAKFVYARKGDADRALKRALRGVALEPGAEEVRIPVLMAGTWCDITFTARHYQGVLAALLAHEV